MNPLSLARFLVSKRTGAPISLVHFVTALCNARCAHCFLDAGLEKFAGPELALSDIETLADSLRGKLYHVSLGGGEPALRPDLAEIAVAYGRRAQARSMLIVSNGSQPDALAEAARRALAECPGMDLIVSLSVDEIGPAHDALRGMPGLFERVLESYRALAALKPQGLSLNANFTMSRRNQDRAVDILREAGALMPEASFSLTAVRGRTADPEAKGIDPARYAEAAEFLDQRVRAGRQPAEYDNFSFGGRLLNARKHLLRGQIRRVLAGRAPGGPCYAGRLSAVLMANGRLYPCEMLDRPMGDVRDFECDLPRLWRSSQAETVRRSIDARRCACTYECAWGVNVVFGVRHWPALLAAFLREARPAS